MTDDTKRMSAAEFRRLGYLQEVNRRFLHPLGLALVVVQEEDGTEHFEDVLDRRDDPEGMAFMDDGPDAWDRTVANRVESEWRAKAYLRQRQFGYAIQGTPGVALYQTGGTETGRFSAAHENVANTPKPAQNID